MPLALSLVGKLDLAGFSIVSLSFLNQTVFSTEMELACCEYVKWLNHKHHVSMDTFISNAFIHETKISLACHNYR